MEKKHSSKLEAAWDCYNTGDFDKAIRLCTAIKSTKKNALRANYILGLIKYDQKEFLNSLAFFNEALKLDIERKGGGLINYWIGKVYEFSDLFGESDNPIYNKQKSLEAYKAAKTYESYPPETVFRILYSEKGQENRIALLEEACEKFPDNIEFYISLSKNCKISGYPTKQIATLNKALSKGIKSSSLCFNLAYYYYEQKKYNECNKYLAQCLEINENSSATLLIYYLLGTSYYEMGDYENAIVDFKHGYETDIKDSVMWYNVIGLVLSLFKLKREAEINELISTVPLDKSLFAYVEFGDYNLMSYFDADMMEEIPFLQDPKDAIKVFEKISQTEQNKEEFLKKGLILQALYFKVDDNHSTLRVLRLCNPYPSGFEFIENRLQEAYADIAKSTELNDELIDSFIVDLNNNLLTGSTKEKSVKVIIDSIFKTKNYKKIIAVCEKLYNSEIENFNILFEYAYSLHEMKKNKEAELYYEKYLKINPKSLAALNNLGLIYKEREEFDKAILLFKEAIKHDNEKELYKNNLKSTISSKEKKIKEDKHNKIPDKWKDAIKSINVDILDRIEYFLISDRIRRLNKKYKSLIERDYNELVFNYLVGNHKSTIVISGSIVEMLLTYYCEKKKHKTIQVRDGNGNQKNRKLYDCVLNDLISFIEEKRLLGNDFQHLGNLARIYRNFIHPGLELKGTIDVKAKSELCFISAIEIFKKIIT